MKRLRKQDGYLSFVGVMAALVLVAVLMLFSLKQFGSGGASGGAGNDAAAMGQAQHAYSALQRCVQDSNANATVCGTDRVVELDPTLMPLRDRLKVTSTPATTSVTIESGDNSFTITSANGGVVRQCQVPGEGRCPPSGRW